MLQKGVSVDLAKVNNPESMPDADKEDALIVAVMRDGRVYFGRIRSARPIDRQDQGSPRQPDRQAVFVRADARAKFGAVVEVVDNVRAAGVDDWVC